MDNFRVPRKVNRHVLKAVRYITDNEDLEYAPFSVIQEHVKYSMRNGNPVHRLDDCIKSSLHNLTFLGILSASDDSKSYAIRNIGDMLVKSKNLAQFDHDQPEPV